MPSPATFESFEKELGRLVAKFEKEHSDVTSPGYTEAQVRQDYLDPFILSLGWDLGNTHAMVQREREVEIESRTDIAGRQKRADYLFRTGGTDRFVCEAKKPREDLGPKYAFQARRYAWNKGLALATLTDFEEIKLYIVGGKPHIDDDAEAGLYKHYHFKQFPLVARELFDLLSRDAIAGGSIDRLLESLPKRPTGKGKARQLYLIKPDRTRSLDSDFLEFLDEARRDLASDLLKCNDRDEILEGTRLNEATQHTLDRILFLRICEDRDIDTGTRLQAIVETWQRSYGRTESRKPQQHELLVAEEGANYLGKLPKESLCAAIVRHFKALDRRPPSHVPFFNGNLFKEHFSEQFLVSDEWLQDFIGELSDDASPYLFNLIPVEILGSVYERFLGKVVRPHGRGVVVEEKPEVRKAGGVYYTPRYIVDYIVEQTVGRQLDEISGILAPLQGAAESETGSGGSAALHHRLCSPSPAGLKQSYGQATQSFGAAIVSEDQNKLAGNRTCQLIDPIAAVVPVGQQKSAEKRADNAVESTAAIVPEGQQNLAGGRASKASEHPRSPAQEGSTPAGVQEAPRFSSFDKQTSALRVLDPACGSGSFLIRAFERVCEHWQRRFKLHPDDRRKEHCWVDPVTDDIHLTVDLKRRILRDNIYGVDLDAQAVEVTQLSLYLKMLEGEDRTTLQRQRELFKDDIALLPPLQDNIKCGNSLIASDFSLDPDDLVRVNAFDWETGFRDIMKAGGFDAVIGNPPYIRIQRIEGAEANYVFSHYHSPASKTDLSLLFIEKGLQLSSSGGRAGFICTSQWLVADYGRKMRMMLSDGRLHQLIDFGSLPVFEDASTYPAVLILSQVRAESVELRRIEMTDQLSLAGIEAAIRIQIPLTTLSDRPWTLGGLNIQGIAARHGVNCRPIADFGKAYIGTKCGLNEAFVLTKEEAKRLKIETDVLLPYAYRGSEVDRYVLAEPESVIIYPYRSGKDGSPELLPESTLRTKYPRAHAHLSSFKGGLRERQDSRKFYARGADWYRHLRAGSFNYIKPSKLLLKGIATRCSVGLLRENTTFDGARCPAIILENLRDHSELYFLGILNSQLATCHLKPLCSPKLHGYIEFSARALTGFPVRTVDFVDKTDRARHDALVALVDKMLVLTPKLREETDEKKRAVLQNAVTATDRKIDDLVYELYGLTEEEIALVEGGK